VPSMCCKGQLDFRHLILLAYSRPSAQPCILPPHVATVGCRQLCASCLVPPCCSVFAVYKDSKPALAQAASVAAVLAETLFLWGCPVATST
jgi:hypothetical protein